MKVIHTLLLLFLIDGLLITSSCTKEVSEEFVGNWETALTKITIPVKEGESENFYIDSVVMGLQISADQTASGYIGMASFTDVRVRKNPGDAEGKGIAYIVKCGELGKLFPSDPVGYKKIEIWLKPVHDNIIGSEINYSLGELWPYMLADPEYHRID